MTPFPNGDLLMVSALAGNPARTDRDIPVALRVLIRASARLGHGNLRCAVLAAERAFTHFSIYRLPESREECWRHIRVGVDWVQHLRRNQTGRVSEQG